VTRLLTCSERFTKMRLEQAIKFRHVYTWYAFAKRSKILHKQNIFASLLTSCYSAAIHRDRPMIAEAPLPLRRLMFQKIAPPTSGLGVEPWHRSCAKANATSCF
jgi:hypothetical protein